MLSVPAPGISPLSRTLAFSLFLSLSRYVYASWGMDMGAVRACSRYLSLSLYIYIYNITYSTYNVYIYVYCRLSK